MTTLQQFINRFDIQLSDVKEHGQRVDEDGWEHNAYTVTLRRWDAETDRWQEITTPWRAGLAIEGAPTVEDVLNSLRVDASSYDDAADFEDFAAQLGMSDDSITALTAYKACGDTRKRLVRFLGAEKHLERLYATDQL